VDPRGDLEQRRSEARRTVRRGVLALVSVPLVAFAAVGAAFGSGVPAVAILAFMTAGLYCLLASLYGLAMIMSGGIDDRRIAKLLRDHDARRQLPEARLVVRD